MADSLNLTGEQRRPMQILPNDAVCFCIGIGNIAADLIVQPFRIGGKGKRHNFRISFLPFHRRKINASAMHPARRSGFETTQPQSGSL